MNIILFLLHFYAGSANVMKARSPYRRAFWVRLKHYTAEIRGITNLENNKHMRQAKQEGSVRNLRVVTSLPVGEVTHLEMCLQESATMVSFGNLDTSTAQKHPKLQWRMDGMSRQFRECAGVDGQLRTILGKPLNI